MSAMLVVLHTRLTQRRLGMRYAMLIEVKVGFSSDTWHIGRVPWRTKFWSDGIAESKETSLRWFCYESEHESMLQSFWQWNSTKNPFTMNRWQIWLLWNRAKFWLCHYAKYMLMQCTESLLLMMDMLTKTQEWLYDAGAGLENVLLVPENT